MTKTGHLRLSLLLIPTVTLLGFSQAKPPQIRSQAEYGAYMAMFNEQDAQKKAALGEKFLTDYNESDYLPQTHRAVIGAYGKAQNWAKVMEAAERAASSAEADNTLKAYAYGNAMVAAQNTNNIDKVIGYGEKVLAIAPDDVDTMMVVSAAIPMKLPSDEAGKKAALDKANGLAAKALATLQPLVAQAQAAQKTPLVQAESQLHATLGLVAYSRPDYKKAVDEYEAAVKGSPKDDLDRYYLGASYSALTAQALKDYQTVFKAWNDAKSSRADQPTIDELDARQQGLAGDIKTYRDRAIEEFAAAVAIGGPVAQQARGELTKLWTAKNDNTNGMEEFIAQRK